MIERNETMKNKMMISVLLGSLLIAGAAFAQPSASSTQEIFFDVNPNISVGPSPITQPVLVTGAAGTYTGTVFFDVHGNTQFVDLQVDATCLYKGSTSTSLNIIPLVGAGALVEAAMGQPVGGAPEMLPWTATIVAGVSPDPTTGIGITTISGAIADVIGNGMQGNSTEVQQYESGQSNSFSQEVAVTCVWQNDNFELPVGEYGGFVKLTAMVVP
jgi:hypothetical protein